MKVPEYILSTPRLIAVILTISLVVLTLQKLIDPKDFVAIVTLVFGYFFGSRGKEQKSESGEVMN